MAATRAHHVGETRTEKGMSLARGPALILGTILLAAGLYFLYKQHDFPTFSANFPNGDVTVYGKVFGIFRANGWTGMLTAVAGGLLLFGAAQHLLAKTMSLIVGVALGAAAVIGAINGNVLGMAAANAWTEIAWGAAAAILLFNTIIPRRRRTVTDYGYASGEAPAAGDEYLADRGRYADDDTQVRDDRVREAPVEDRAAPVGIEPLRSAAGRTRPRRRGSTTTVRRLADTNATPRPRGRARGARDRTSRDDQRRPGRGRDPPGSGGPPRADHARARIGASGPASI